MKPSMSEKPDHRISHIGTNDLNKDRAPDLIAKSITDLAITMKSNSNIVMRNDKFNDKAVKLDGHLKRFSIEKNIFLIDHTKTFHPRNINKSKLHLNKSETSILSSNFVKAISNVLD